MYTENEREYLDVLRYQAGMPPVATDLWDVRRKSGKYDYESLRQTEWSPQFEEYMRNRLIMGAMRYGVIGDPCKPKYDRIASIIKRATLYAETGNQDWLVDVANEAMLEFVEPTCHPNPYFGASDDGCYHTQTIGK